MKLMGYTDRISAASGEQLRFMVSAEVPAYDVQIVRLIHGDADPSGPGFKRDAVDAAVNGRYTGRYQPIQSGSYVLAPDDSTLQGAAGLTIQAWIQPTLPQRDHVQGILAVCPEGGVGIGLGLGQDGRLQLRIGEGAAASRQVAADTPLLTGQWYFVACTLDAGSRTVRLYQHLLAPWPVPGGSATVEHTLQMPFPETGPARLLIAADSLDTASGKDVASGLFNGKIEAPRLYRRALAPDEIAALRGGTAPIAVAADALVAAWDFSLGMDTATATDISGHGLHGTVVHMPTRAVTGHTWTGRVVDARQAPDQYGAIHFHEDDQADAGWEPDFTWTIPDGARSGVYAAHLTAGAEEDYIPFYIRPARSTARAPIAFLASTMTYLAYADKPGLTSSQDALRTPGHAAPSAADHYLAEHPELGGSLYDLHVDGSGVCYSSWLRPILTMRPTYPYKLTLKPRNYSGDLYLIDWLESQGFAYDVITDHDLHEEGAALLAPYRAVLTGTHPEYWTTPMMDGLDRYLGGGGRLMYLGGNGFYWVTSVDPQRPQVIEVRRGTMGTRAWTSEPGEAYHSTTGELGGLWRLRGRSPQRVDGVGFTAQGWGPATGYRRQAGSFDPRAAFIFEGLGEDEIIGDFGLVLGGAAGDEIDRADPRLGTPPHALVLATSTGHDDYYQFVVEEADEMFPGNGGKDNPLVRSDLTYFEMPNGGAVFSVGSITWCSSLSHNGYDNNVSRITGNVLRRFQR